MGGDVRLPCVGTRMVSHFWWDLSCCNKLRVGARDRLQASQSRQKAYADRRRRLLEFEAGEHVFLRVTRTTGVGRAIRSRKLSPRFLGPYQILRRIGPVAYEIALPPQLANLHPVFHVS